MSLSSSASIPADVVQGLISHPPTRPSDLVSSLRRSLNREPDPSDLYNLARELHLHGSPSLAALALDPSVGRAGRVPGGLQGRHLLGHCLVNVAGRKHEAIQHLIAAASEYPENWQLIVEAKCEIDAGFS
jgi:hypothetical protein